MNFDEALKQFETSLISFANTICEKIIKQNQELENVYRRLSALQESFERCPLNNKGGKDEVVKSAEPV